MDMSRKNNRNSLKTAESVSRAICYWLFEETHRCVVTEKTISCVVIICNSYSCTCWINQCQTLNIKLRKKLQQHIYEISFQLEEINILSQHCTDHRRLRNSYFCSDSKIWTYKLSINLIFTMFFYRIPQFTC